MTKHTVVFVRHGQSVTNSLKIFCGWYDTPLTDLGRQQAQGAGRLLKQNGYAFDNGFTSALSRARDTLTEILKELQITTIPVIQSWRLNECHLGEWTGMHRDEFLAKHGEKKYNDLHIGADVDIPPMRPDHQHYDAVVRNPVYKDVLTEDEVPKRETFSEVVKRSVPFWEDTIVPEIKNGKLVIVVSHKMALKSLMLHLEPSSHEKIADMNIPNSVPFVYYLDDNMKPIETFRFITSEDKR